MKNLFVTVVFILFFGFVSIFADWEPLSGIPQGQITDILAYNKRVYSIVWSNGLYVSSDYGDNWVQQSSGLSSPFVKCITNVKNTLLIGTSDTNGVFRSTDNGFNWVRSVDSLTERNIATFTVDGDNVYLLTESAVVFRSTDYGVTWWQVNTSNLDNYLITSIAVSNGRILAGTSTGDLFLSTDNGESWANIKNQQIFSTITSLLWDGDNIFCGTRAGVYFSSNTGVNWFQRNLGLKVQDISLIKRVNNALVLGSRTGGVYFSLDEGRTWFEFNEGITDMSILSLTYDQYYIYVGTEFGSVARRNISEIKLPEVKAPNLTYPSNGAKNVEKVVNFAWETAKGAVGYRILVAKNESFSPNFVVVDKSGLTNPFYPSVILQPNRKYYWKVAAIDHLSKEHWSEVFSFETIFERVRPTLYYPFNNFETSKLPIQFIWSDVGFLEHYQLQVASSIDFQNLVVDVTTKDTTFVVYNNIENNKTYFWRVIAKYNDASLVVSDTFNFKTTVLGIEQENDRKIHWQMFDSKLIIGFENFEANRIFSIEVFDFVGRSVLFGWFESSGSKNTAELNLNNLPTGMYYVIVNGANMRFSNRFFLTK